MYASTNQLCWNFSFLGSLSLTTLFCSVFRICDDKHETQTRAGKLVFPAVGEECLSFRRILTRVPYSNKWTNSIMVHCSPCWLRLLLNGFLSVWILKVMAWWSLISLSSTLTQTPTSTVQCLTWLNAVLLPNFYSSWSVCLTVWLSGIGRTMSDVNKEAAGLRLGIEFSVASSSDEHKRLQLTSASRFSDADTEVAGHLQAASFIKAFVGKLKFCSRFIGFQGNENDLSERLISFWYDILCPLVTM